ncbi:MAG TPA: MFS transporter [Vicinamibacterales bacterium]|nr:MFS transporter [Vicinamibacterales bacterium]
MTSRLLQADPPAAPPPGRRAAYYGLTILTLLNFLNYVDRYILAAVLPAIKIDLTLTDFQLGLLTNAFLVAYFVTSPVFGRLGDRLRRTPLIAIGVAIWSAATTATGVVRSFLQMASARAVIGVGEAAYGTIAPALLADYFPPARRGGVFSIFYVAIPVGSAIGFLLGGFLEQRYDWRTAFFAVGLPGLALAILALSAPDPPRGILDAPSDRAAQAAARTLSAGAALRVLLRNRLYASTVLGYAAYTFAVGGFGTWMPTYLQRIRGLDLARADYVVGGITVVAGLGGTFIGGFLADRLRPRLRNADLLVSGVSMLLAAPASWLALSVAAPSAYIGAFFAAEFLIFLSTGPINVVLISSVAVSLRAQAMAASIFTIHLLGDAVSPPLIGWLADRHGLADAVLVVPAAVAVCSAIWLTAAFLKPKAQSPKPVPPV